MFTVRELGGAIPQLELSDEDSGSRVRLAPSRGALVTSLFVHGREWLYLDEATFLDVKQNVRGGVPVLFPTPGKLEGDAWTRGGKSGALKQHGFARTSTWTEVARETSAAAKVTLALEDSEATRAQFPWRFRVELSFALAGSALDIGISVKNTGDVPMPFGFGFHPYFQVAQSEKGAARIPTPATRAWDNAAKKEIAFAGFDLTAREVDLHLEDHGGSACALVTPHGTVKLEGTRELSRWVIWTLAGKDFVCVEPWTCPGDALNSGRDLIELPAGATREMSLRLGVRPPVVK